MISRIPKIGMMVLYFPDPSMDPPFNGAKCLPAFIVHVHSNTLLNLQVLNDGDANFRKVCVDHGSGWGTWQWPENYDQIDGKVG